jgi:hypothetical protein
MSIPMPYDLKPLLANEIILFHLRYTANRQNICAIQAFEVCPKQTVKNSMADILE